MNYLFLDASTKSTGWCVKNDKNELIQYGCITSGSQNVFKRIGAIRDGVKDLITKYDIKKIILEEVHLDEFKNTQTYKTLTWLQGIILLQAYELNKIDYQLIQPNTWRSKIGIHTGRGIKREQLKKADIEYVKTKYNIEVNDDIADAICLADSYFVKDDKLGFDWS